MDASWPRLGILVGSFFDRYQTLILDGVLRQANAAGLGTAMFDCSAIDHPQPAQRYKNIMLDLVAPEGLVGLIVLGGSLLNYGGKDRLVACLEHFGGIPRVCIGLNVPGIPALSIDNRGSTCSLIEHMIEVHGHRAIAYLRGPQDNEEARDRYLGYVDALERTGLPLNPELVLDGHFERVDGRLAVRRLLERGVRVDALVAADDYMALGAMEALEGLGLPVPGAMAVAGFDDIDLAANSQPSLTTMYQPTFELGEAAVLLIRRMLAGEGVPALTRLGVSLVRRESCGCGTAAAGAEAGPGKGLGTAGVAEGWSELRARLRRRMGIEDGSIQEQTMLARSIDGVLGWYLERAGQPRPDGELVDLGTLFRASLATGLSLAIWQDVLEECHGLCGDKDVRFEASSLLLRAAAELAAERLQQREHRAVLIERTGDSLMTCFDDERIRSLTALACSDHDLRGVILRGGMGEAAEAGAGAGELYLQLLPERNREIENTAVWVADLLPGGALCPMARHLVYEPLQRDQEAWGLGVFQAGLLSPKDLATLADRISRAMAGAELMSRVQGYAQQLEAEVASRTAELQEANRRLMEKSYTDELSGLRNRRFLTDIIEPDARRLVRTIQFQHLQRDKRNGPERNDRMGILLLDIDFFKFVNDNHGHDTGDLVIREISAALMASVRDTDTVVRYGGEEFMVVLRNMDADWLLEIAEKIRKRIENLNVTSPEGLWLATTCSIGCTTCPTRLDCPNPPEFWQAVTLADLGLLWAKEHGRNQVVRMELAPLWVPAGQPAFKTMESLVEGVDQGLLSLSQSAGKPRRQPG